MLKVVQTLMAQKAFPTGDPNFAVMQAWPGAFQNEAVTDPFLMLDYFGPTKSKGVIADPDKFMVGWHPHRGMDITTYMVSGVGRHADSMGNRETFASPGMQWISVGSGIEHAEAGGTPEGESEAGFQIWINVPKEKKMLPPKYGTHGPSTLPVIMGEGFSGRLLAGRVGDKQGPFQTATAVEMIDITIAPGASWSHALAPEYDQSLVFCYKGQGTVNAASCAMHGVVQLDAQDVSGGRTVEIAADATSTGMSCMLFSGKRIGEPIAWRGPFVMNTQQELQQCMAEVRSGQFPPVRVPWDYKKLSSFPKDKQQCKEVL